MIGKVEIDERKKKDIFLHFSTVRRTLRFYQNIYKCRIMHTLEHVSTRLTGNFMYSAKLFMDAQLDNFLGDAQTRSKTDTSNW